MRRKLGQAVALEDEAFEPLQVADVIRKARDEVGAQVERDEMTQGAHTDRNLAQFVLLCEQLRDKDLVQLWPYHITTLYH